MARIVRCTQALAFAKRARAVAPALLLSLMLAVMLAFTGCVNLPTSWFGSGGGSATTAPTWFDPASVPAYDGSPSVEVNGNVPFFAEADFARQSFEEYSPLDARGRCGSAFALIGEETLPTEPRGEIHGVHPSGWQSGTYDWVDQGSLYNRCHLIAWQLAGENDNPNNLITGTRTMNTQGMLPYENRVAWYVQTTGNHVLYRVTPVFEGANLVASGVLMEAESVEDVGQGVRFCVWCYNVEPGVRIDYATGKNEPDGTMGAEPAQGEAPMRDATGTEGSSASAGEGAERAFTIPGDEYRTDAATATYILNMGTGKFHFPYCPSVSDMSERNKFPFAGTREQALELGYSPCGACKP